MDLTELTFPGTPSWMVKTLANRKIQEHLNLWDFGCVVDDVYGPATKATLSRFIRESNKTTTYPLLAPALTDQQVWALLVAPMERAVDYNYPSVDIDVPSETIGSHVLKMEIGEAIAFLANIHRLCGARELPHNRGPWVRMYTGSDGNPWCMGFVMSMIEQVTQFKSLAKWPLPWARPTIGDAFRLSCSHVYQLADDAGLIIENTDALRPGDIMLVKNPDPDAAGGTPYVHTGVVDCRDEDNKSVIWTVEGNANLPGQSEGTTVARKARALTGKTFFRVLPS